MCISYKPIDSNNNGIKKYEVYKKYTSQLNREFFCTCDKWLVYEPIKDELVVKTIWGQMPIASMARYLVGIKNTGKILRVQRIV